MAQRMRPVSSLERAWNNAHKLTAVADASAFAQAQMNAGAPVDPAEIAAVSASTTRSSSGLTRTPVRAHDGISRWSDGVDAVQPPAMDSQHHFGSVFDPRGA